MPKTFEDIKAWQLARQYRKNIYKVSSKFPKDELYALVNQMRRAAVSVTSNLAEGYGRYTWQENIRFCLIARGSVNEILDQLYVAVDESYITQEEFNTLYPDGREIEKAINGYISFLKQQRSQVS